MRRPKQLETIIVAAAAVLVISARFVPGQDTPGPVTAVAASLVDGGSLVSAATRAVPTADAVAAEVQSAIGALASAVRPLSSSEALADAFRSYFAFKAAHPDQVRKPYLYFVDYGLPSTTERGYVFDMDALKIVDGPFTVAHGRGSSKAQYGIPTHFSNGDGSNATSLGLYVAEDLYAFHGRAGGRAYSSVGLRLMGVSTGFDDRAMERGVVAHGAPYVTATKAGRSEGCPAMEPTRAARLLPKLADGGLVFLFAPDSTWLAGDPWVTGSAGETPGA